MPIRKVDWPLGMELLLPNDPCRWIGGNFGWTIDSGGRGSPNFGADFGFSPKLLKEGWGGGRLTIGFEIFGAKCRDSGKSVLTVSTSMLSFFIAFVTMLFVALFSFLIALSCLVAFKISQNFSISSFSNFVLSREKLISRLEPRIV